MISPGSLRRDPYQANPITKLYSENLFTPPPGSSTAYSKTKFWRNGIDLNRHSKSIPRLPIEEPSAAPIQTPANRVPRLGSPLQPGQGVSGAFAADVNRLRGYGDQAPSAVPTPHWTQIPNGGVAQAPMHDTPSSVPTPPNPGIPSQTPINRYNSINMNVYRTPGGSVAAGLGHGLDPSTDRLIGQNRAENSRRLMTGTQRSLVDNHDAIMANRAAIEQLQSQGTPPVSRPGFNRGSYPMPGSEAALNNVSMGPANASTAMASQREAMRMNAQRQLMARRAAMMSGQPLLPQFRQPGAQPVQQQIAQSQPRVVGPNGMIMPSQNRAPQLAQAPMAQAPVQQQAMANVPPPQNIPNPRLVNQQGRPVSPFDLTPQAPNHMTPQTPEQSFYHHYMTPLLNGSPALNPLYDAWYGNPAPIGGYRQDYYGRR